MNTKLVALERQLEKQDISSSSSSSSPQSSATVIVRDMLSMRLANDGLGLGYKSRLMLTLPDSLRLTSEVKR